MVLVPKLPCTLLSGEGFGGSDRDDEDDDDVNVLYCVYCTILWPLDDKHLESYNVHLYECQ